MKPKDILIFFIGVCVGSGITYYVVNNKANKRADEEINSVIKAYNEKIAKNEEKNIPVDDSDKTLKVTQPKPNINEMANYKKQATNYYTITNLNGEDSDAELYEEVKDTVEEVTNVDNIFDHEIYPYPIDSDRYYNDDSYEKKELYYYTYDDVLSDDKGNMILDYDEMLGDGVDYFNDEEDAAYIRNEFRATDYKIILKAQAFASPSERDGPMED